MNLLQRISLLALSVLLSGCTGQWENDDKNWDRAFSGNPPEGVTVIHSLYWRTQYLPREDGWTFEVKLSPDRRKLLFEDLKLRPLKPGDDGTVELLTKNQPGWFPQKPLSRYIIWIRDEERAVPAGAFEDKESGVLFLVAVGL